MKETSCDSEDEKWEVRLQWSQVFTEENIRLALEDLSKKRDGSGADGVKLSELPEYWELNRERVLRALEDETYRPGIVTCCEIVNYKGKKRTITLQSFFEQPVFDGSGSDVGGWGIPILSIFG